MAQLIKDKQIVADTWLPLELGENDTAESIALPAGGGWIMYLKKELQDTAIGNLIRIKEYFDTFGVRAMITVGGIGNIAPRVSNPRFLYARQLANQILHAPETATC